MAIFSMKYKLTTSTICLFAFLACDLQKQSKPQTLLEHETIQIHFSPGGSPTTAVLKTLDNATKSVLVQAYSFTSAPIAAALKRAHDRGVAVNVILDRSQRSERYTSATFLQHAGISVWIDSAHAISHNKVMVIDESIVITGSFNFTKSAEERNAENLLVINSQHVAREYTANWKKHMAHSKKY
jgi:phosphatidylserine/phosphatidylglycerophosphate/cardiolipin synthase-like enzyme